MDHLTSWNFGATVWYDDESSRNDHHKIFLVDADIKYFTGQCRILSIAIIQVLKRDSKG